MNFALFERLSAEEAEEYKTHFLELGHAALPALIADARAQEVEPDLRVASVVPVFEWLSGLATTLPRAPDPSLPEWIRASDNYEKNLFDFDDQSRILILRAAYYLGESFVRSHPSLTWAVGEADTAPQGQPVVRGFASGLELPVLLVAENLFADAVTEGSAVDTAQRAIQWWETKVLE